MSIQALAWVLEHERTTTGTDRLVLMSIANHTDQKGEAFPSYQLMALEVNAHVDTVKRSVRRLVEQGLLERDVKAAPDRRFRADRRTNLYRITGYFATLRDRLAALPHEGDESSPSPQTGTQGQRERDNLSPSQPPTDEGDEPSPSQPHEGDDLSERGGRSVPNEGGESSPQSLIEPSENQSLSPGTDTTTLDELAAETVRIITDRRIATLGRKPIDPDRYRTAVARGIRQDHWPTILGHLRHGMSPHQVADNLTNPQHPNTPTPPPATPNRPPTLDELRARKQAELGPIIQTDGTAQAGFAAAREALQ